MEIRELAVPDAHVLDLVPHGDSRGRFTEWYKADVLAGATGFGLTLVQANHSVSARGCSLSRITESCTPNVGEPTRTSTTTSRTRPAGQ